MFNLGMGEMVLLVVVALVIFGDRLPTVARQTGRTLRQLRQMATSAQQDLRDGLGPEFRDFDVNDLNPRNFVRKHLFEDPDDDDDDRTFRRNRSLQPAGGEIGPDERPPFDSEAT